MGSTRRRFLGGFLSGLTGGFGLAGGGVKGESLNAAQAKTLPVCLETDVCVLGGSATGVFAAVRAARLGAKAAIVERQNGFGGVATGALVNVWHSLYDTEFERKIIGGLTEETIARLKKRGAIHAYDRNDSAGVALNSPELKMELDEMILESKVHPFLGTLFSEPYYEDGELTGVIVDGKSGRRIIKARVFIDATGDGDLCVRMGLGSRVPRHPQPPTLCAHFDGLRLSVLNRLLAEHGDEFGIPSGFLWGIDLPGTRGFMLAGTRIYGVDCADADDLTGAEIEGRRQLRAMMDLWRKYEIGPGAYEDDSKTPPIFGLTAIGSTLGVRQSRHIDCLYRVTDDDALYGRRFDDAVANGSYNFDVHHDDKPGNTFRSLDGTEAYIAPGQPEVHGRWRPETAENPTFYQIPFRSIVPKGGRNVILAGRMFDAEEVAFSGMRVMVNMNQLGEAAGVAAYLALDGNLPIDGVRPSDVRRLLADGGSVVI